MTSPPAVVGPRQMSFTACTCFGVRQLASSAPSPHVRAAGSKSQARGSSSTPSSMPSMASHAAVTASPSSTALAGGIQLSGSSRVASAYQRWAPA